ncbi:hypothetical protein HMPREF0758_3493 [Serratia odorifera DSM 4582]|uniref:Uncharacterized protein n=1 Tax=Serratia odorifera DSM 4582 TaxID=667129 RepID=D4E5P3_SEROD|nr:hypothetical protein HMPREF0758_3493 [Serratia odorifera DSM 4582]
MTGWLGVCSLAICAIPKLWIMSTKTMINDNKKLTALQAFLT